VCQFHPDITVPGTAAGPRPFAERSSTHGSGLPGPVHCGNSPPCLGTAIRILCVEFHAIHGFGVSPSQALLCRPASLRLPDGQLPSRSPVIRQHTRKNPHMVLPCGGTEVLLQFWTVSAVRPIYTSATMWCQDSPLLCPRQLQSRLCLRHTRTARSSIFDPLAPGSHPRAAAVHDHGPSMGSL